MIKLQYSPTPWRVARYATRQGKTQTIVQGAASNICRMDIAGRLEQTLDGDARLIAAAPDLLVVAESGLKILQSLYSTPTESGLLNGLEYQILEQAIADTEAAIAAAKGE